MALLNDKMLEAVADKAVASLFRSKTYPFIAGGQLRLMREGVNGEEAWHLARRTAKEFIRNERISFGDPRYDWSAEAGAVLVEENEIRHWEAR